MSTTLPQGAVPDCPPQTDQPSTRDWLAVASLALVAFVIVTSEFIPVGLLPDITDSLHVSLGLGGLMVLVPALTAAISAPLLYLGARNFNRRWLIAVLGGLVVISNVIPPFASSLTEILLARILLGIAIAGFWTVVPPLGPRLVGERLGTRAMSIVIAGVSAGTVVGLPAGQFLGNAVGWRTTFAVAAAVSAVVVIAQLVFLPDIRPEAATHGRDLGRVFRSRRARTGVAVITIAFIGQFAASTYLTPFLEDFSHLSSGSVSIVFLLYGVGGILGTLIGGPLVGRNVTGSLVIASGIVGVIVLALPVLHPVPVVVAALIVSWGLVWGVIPLAAQVWLLRAVPDGQEAAASIAVSTMQLSIAAGSALGGLLVDSTSLRTVFITGGAVLILSALVATTGTGRRQIAR
ncbi:MAG TPA: MFS transporter [Kribbella sp.]|uniref:MFS transporter n=1 Tax=Kribbella sp. TaxID=1871183 RepID=UPI002D7A0A6A|nr:MFS transporter [Kribbella sp.]HET6294571.1 MFS transporter [Kribbella sp.]